MSGKDQEVFSALANCYGYAVKCKTPINSHNGGQAVPAGEKYSGNLDNYCQRLKQGILSDGGNKVSFLSEASVNTLQTANIPTPRSGWYLIALLVKKDGFHFVRRQLKHLGGEPFWKWKQGNPGKVERNAYDFGTAKAWVRVTNANFPELIKGSLLTDVPGYKGWDKVYFFEVDKSGFNVTSYVEKPVVII